MEEKKTKTMPGWARILILLIILVIGIAAYAGLRAYNEHKEEEDTAMITMLSVDNDKVISFTYELDGVVYTYSRENSKSDWVYQQDPELKLDQSTVTGMLSTATSVSTEQIVADNLDNAAEYGLEEPSFTLTIILKDGTEKILCLGSVNSMTSDYYAFIKDDNRIFTLNQDFYNSFTTAEELADASSMSELSSFSD